ncbi:MAG: hypothetical protein H6Q90_3540 [Deltaproteobacteria bacterium]|nr:hypothetical protein [Deltaproteobacteria bacterium]
MPCERPFRRPDASNGGARSVEEALAEAGRVAGRELSVIEPYWARAWSRVLRGEDPPRRPTPRSGSARPGLAQSSAWSILLVAPGASPAEVRRAYHARARATHPDHGGDAEQFRAVQRAYERLETRRLVGPRRKTR